MINESGSLRPVMWSIFMFTLWWLPIIGAALDKSNNRRWAVCTPYSSLGFEPLSFCNSTAEKRDEGTQTSPICSRSNNEVSVCTQPIGAHRETLSTAYCTTKTSRRREERDVIIKFHLMIHNNWWLSADVPERTCRWRRRIWLLIWVCLGNILRTDLIFKMM